MVIVAVLPVARFPDDSVLYDDPVMAPSDWFIIAVMEPLELKRYNPPVLSAEYPVVKALSALKAIELTWVDAVTLSALMFPVAYIFPVLPVAFRVIIGVSVDVFLMTIAAPLTTDLLFGFAAVLLLVTYRPDVCIDALALELFNVI